MLPGCEGTPVRGDVARGEAERPLAGFAAGRRFGAGLRVAMRQK